VQHAILYNILHIEEPVHLLQEAYRALSHSKRKENEATTTPFKAGPRKGSRIDWIGLSRDWKVVSAEIDHTSRDGRTPSDHFPITAVIRQ